MKKLIIVILVFIIILTAAFFLLQRCELREKPEEEITETEEVEETDKLDEKSAFINASIEFTCKVLKDPTLEEDEGKMKEELNKSYQKFGLPVEDDEKMVSILDKYENDTEVLNIIKENTKACQ
ncbi:hypothetical protein GF366_04495 [Candidatus Peregrinibacteria bacterium]|nr:hypothetical protein [Candidatus Peregrinibacteria bacterium]